MWPLNISSLNEIPKCPLFLKAEVVKRSFDLNRKQLKFFCDVTSGLDGV